jgi:hypothetical protein
VACQPQAEGYRMSTSLGCILLQMIESAHACHHQAKPSGDLYLLGSNTAGFIYFKLEIKGNYNSRTVFIKLSYFSGRS